MRYLTLLSLLILAGCSSPVSRTDIAMTKYDKDTEYGIKETQNGFDIAVLYSRFQIIPESDSVSEACKSQLTSIAWEYSDSVKKPIQEINEQRIRISMGRNGFSGITSCSASASAVWE